MSHPYLSDPTASLRIAHEHQGRLFREAESRRTARAASARPRRRRRRVVAAAVTTAPLLYLAFETAGYKHV